MVPVLVAGKSVAVSCEFLKWQGRFCGGGTQGGVCGLMKEKDLASAGGGKEGGRIGKAVGKGTGEFGRELPERWLLERG